VSHHENIVEGAGLTGLVAAFPAHAYLKKRIDSGNPVAPISVGQDSPQQKSL
jgi:hypothetical protein